MLLTPGYNTDRADLTYDHKQANYFATKGKPPASAAIQDMT